MFLANTTKLQNVANIMVKIGPIVYTILIAVSIIVPMILILFKKKGLKNQRPGAMIENNYVLSDKNLKNNFELIRLEKEKHCITFVANEYTKRAKIALINFSKRKKIDYYSLNFASGKVVRIPVPYDTKDVLIAALSVNGTKMVNDFSPLPSTGTIVATALVPTLLMFTACLYTSFTLSFALTKSQYAVLSGSTSYNLSYLCFLGIPLIVVGLKLFDKMVTK